MASITLEALGDDETTVVPFSHAESLTVREEIGFNGTRAQFVEPERATRRPTNLQSRPTALHVGLGGERERALAAQHQTAPTSREWAPSALYPGQQRPHETRRVVEPKNMVEFEAVGRNIGPHSTANAVGGYAGMNMAGEDVTEKFTQRTHDDFLDYYHPTTAARTEAGNASVYSLFDQNRIEARELSYKDTVGRFAGAFNHDIRLPNSPMERMWHKDAYEGGRPTMKADYWMAHRNRESEHPNREGLRQGTSRIYDNGWEKLEPFRRKETQVLQEIDHSLIQAWAINPYSPPLMAVRYSGQNNVDLNDPTPLQ